MSVHYNIYIDDETAKWIEKNRQKKSRNKFIAECLKKCQERDEINEKIQEIIEKQKRTTALLFNILSKTFLKNNLITKQEINEIIESLK